MKQFDKICVYDSKSTKLRRWHETHRTHDLCSQTASAETDTSVLHHLPSLPACQGADWRKLTSQLDIPSLLVLNQGLPHHLRDQWRFLYSSGLHGASFATLLSHMTRRGPTVLLVRDSGGHLFGGFAADSWEIGPSFTGKWSKQIRPSGYACEIP